MLANAPLHFVHITDTHLSHDPQYTHDGAPHTPLEGARALVAAVNALPFQPDFVLHTGDIAYDPDPAAYALAADVLGQFNSPLYVLAGNHDDGAMLHCSLGDSTLAAPYDYTFEVKGVQVICVDSNRPAEPPQGAMSAEQRTWLETLCAADDDRPLIVAVHHNVLPVGVPWLDGFMRLRDGEAFHRALLPARRRIRGVFHGHIHQATETYCDGILYASAPSTWYQLHGYPGQTDIMFDNEGGAGFNVVTVTREQTFIRRYALRVK